MKLRVLLTCLAIATPLLAPAAASASVSTDPDVATYSHLQYAFNHAFCLSFQDGNTANGTPLQIFNCNATPQQMWIRVHVVDEDHLDYYAIQNKATQKCIQAASSSFRSALVEEPCKFNSLPPDNTLQLWTRGSGAGACPNIGQVQTWVHANGSHFPDGDIWPSGGNVSSGVHMYMNHPPSGQPLSKVCWTVPNEIILS
jgi:hypothetical protein